MEMKERLKQWNVWKWETKNQAMYEKFDENRWPWFNEDLDPDIEAYLQDNNLQNLDILDLGTCTASQAIELAKRGHNLVGSDISDTALAKAREALAKQPDVRVELVKDDITESKLAKNQFDMILDRGCYHSICVFNTPEYIAGVKRVLKPGGILLLKTMSSKEERFVAYDKIAENLTIQMPFHFTEEKFHEVLGPHFDILEVRDSFFYSTVVNPPAQARFVIIRNRAE